MLKVSPWKLMIRFGKRGKLNPRYIGPFDILERIGPVSYRFKLSHELEKVHDVCHVSNLKKCLADDTLVIPSTKSIKTLNCTSLKNQLRLWTVR